MEFSKERYAEVSKVINSDFIYFKIDENREYDSVRTIKDVKEMFGEDETLFNRVSTAAVGGLGCRNSLERIMHCEGIDSAYVGNMLFKVFMTYPSRHNLPCDSIEEFNMSIIDGYKSDWELDFQEDYSVGVDEFKGVFANLKGIDSTSIRHELYDDMGRIKFTKENFSVEIHKPYIDEILTSNGITKEEMLFYYPKVIKERLNELKKKNSDADNFDNTERDIKYYTSLAKDVVASCDISGETVTSLDDINSGLITDIQKSSKLLEFKTGKYYYKFNQKDIARYFTLEEFRSKGIYAYGDLTEDGSLVDVMFRNDANDDEIGNIASNKLVFDTKSNLVFVLQNNLVCAFGDLEYPPLGGVELKHIKEYYGYFKAKYNNGVPIKGIPFFEWEDKASFITDWLWYADTPKYGKLGKKTTLEDVSKLFSDVKALDTNSFEYLEAERAKIKQKKLIEKEERELLYDLYSGYDVCTEVPSCITDSISMNMDKYIHVDGFVPPTLSPYTGVTNIEETRNRYKNNILGNHNDYISSPIHSGDDAPIVSDIIYDEIFKAMEWLEINQDYTDKYNQAELYSLIDLGEFKHNVLVKQLEFAKLNNLTSLLPDLYDTARISKNIKDDKTQSQKDFESLYDDLSEDELDELYANPEFKKEYAKKLAEFSKQKKDGTLELSPYEIYMDKVRRKDADSITDEEVARYCSRYGEDIRIKFRKEALGIKQTVNAQVHKPKPIGKKRMKELRKIKEEFSLDKANLRTKEEINKLKEESMKEHREEVTNSKSDKLVEMLLTNSKIMEKTLKVETDLLNTNADIVEELKFLNESSKESKSKFMNLDKKLDRVDSKVSLIRGDIKELNAKIDSLLEALEKKTFNDNREDDVDENEEDGPTLENAKNKGIKIGTESPKAESLDEEPMDGYDYSFAEMGEEIVTKYAPISSMRGSSIEYPTVDFDKLQVAGMTVEGGYEHDLIGKAPVIPFDVMDNNNRIIYTYLCDKDMMPKTAVIVSQDNVNREDKIIFIYRDGYIVSWGRLKRDFTTRGDIKWKTLLDMSEFPYNSVDGQPPMNAIGFTDDEYLNDYAEMLKAINDSGVVVTTKPIADRIFVDCFTRVAPTSKSEKKSVKEYTPEGNKELDTPTTNVIDISKPIDSIEDRKSKINDGLEEFVTDINGNKYTIRFSGVYGRDIFVDDENYESLAITLQNGSTSYVNELHNHGVVVKANKKYVDETPRHEVINNMNDVCLSNDGELLNTGPSLFDEFGTQDIKNYDKYKEWVITYNGFSIRISDDPAKIWNTVDALSKNISDLTNSGNTVGVTNVISLVARLYIAGTTKLQNGGVLEQRNENMMRACEQVLSNHGLLNNAISYANLYDRNNPTLNKHEEAMYI